MPNYTGVRVQIPPLTPAKRPGSYLKDSYLFCCLFRKTKKTTVRTALRVSILITNQEIAQAIVAAIWIGYTLFYIQLPIIVIVSLINFAYETLLSSVNSKVYWFSPLLNIINPLYS